MGPGQVRSGQLQHPEQQPQAGRQHEAEPDGHRGAQQVHILANGDKLLPQLRQPGNVRLINVTAVPLPASARLLLSGLVVLAVMARRRRTGRTCVQVLSEYEVMGTGSRRHHERTHIARGSSD